MIIDSDGRVWRCPGASCEEIKATAALWRAAGIDVKVKPGLASNARMAEPSDWDREAAAMYESGRSLCHVAGQMKCSTDRVRGALRRCGMMARKKGPAQTSDERTQIMIERYQSGATLQQIGDEHHISRERVRQLLVRAGFDPHPHGWNRVQRRIAREADVQRRVELGDTLPDIAAALGISSGSVARIYRRIGVGSPLRPGRRQTTRTKRAIEMFDAGASLEDIAASLGFKNKIAVSSTLYRYGRTLQRREMVQAQETRA